MTNKNLLLGRSKPSEKLTREEIAALDKVPRLPRRRRSRLGRRAEVRSGWSAGTC